MEVAIDVPVVVVKPVTLPVEEVGELLTVDVLVGELTADVAFEVTDGPVGELTGNAPVGGLTGDVPVRESTGDVIFEDVVVVAPVP